MNPRHKTNRSTCARRLDPHFRNETHETSLDWRSRHELSLKAKNRYYSVKCGPLVEVPSRANPLPPISNMFLAAAKCFRIRLLTVVVRHRSSVTQSLLDRDCHWCTVEATYADYQGNGVSGCDAFGNVRVHLIFAGEPAH